MKEEEKKATWYKNKIKRDAEYIKTNVRRYVLAFNKNTDAKLIEHIETKENKQGYIKSLIVKDMED